MVAFRIPLLRTASPVETAVFVAHAAAQESRRLGPPRREPVPDGRRVSMDVLSAIPGVGDGKARRLLDRFGSVTAVAKADERLLGKTPGVGPSTAQSIRRALD
jgi:ERCC4-type nuclease